MVFVGLGALAGVLAWLVMLWASLVAIGALLFAIAVAREDVAPRLPIYLLGSAWTIGVATWTLLRVLEVGRPDEWGDYWLAMAVLGVLLAIGTQMWWRRRLESPRGESNS